MSPGRKHLPGVIKVNPDSTHSLMSLITLDDESNDFSVNGPSSKRRDSSSSRTKLGLWQASMKNDRFAPILNPTRELSPKSRNNKSRLSLPVRKASVDCLRMPRRRSSAVSIIDPNTMATLNASFSPQGKEKVKPAAATTRVLLTNHQTSNPIEGLPTVPNKLFQNMSPPSLPERQQTRGSKD